MNDQDARLRIGELVLLMAVPPGFLDGLDEDDQRAITAMIGKPVTLVGWDETGAAELHFDDPFHRRTDESSHTHSIWVAREYITRVED